MFKDNLKAIREQRKLTKKEVAAGAGISERAYIAYEYGERDVSTDTLCKLADFYEVSTDELLGRDKPEKTALERLESEYHMSPLEKNIMEGYIQLTRDERDKVMEFIRENVEKSGE